MSLSMAARRASRPRRLAILAVMSVLAAAAFSEQDGRVALGLKGTCDQTFAPSPCGSATAGQAETESLAMYGPKSSTDQSQTFTTQITWTAS